MASIRYVVTDPPTTAGAKGRSRLLRLSYRARPAPAEVAVAGAGNDSRGLRAGACKVDAIEIDPVILMVGQQSHPEQPYGDTLARAQPHPTWARRWRRA